MLLAVYGTLRREGGAHVILKLLNAEFLGMGRVRGYRMFASRIPFAVKSEDRRDEIIVELYEVPDEKIPLLDHYEEGYVRRMVEVELEDGNTVEAWMYVWEHPLEDVELVEGGDWVKFIGGRSGCRRSTKL